MALKDRWSRMVRKSVSSASSGGDGPNSASNDEGDSLSKPPSRLAKTLTWLSTNTATPSSPPSPTEERKKKKKATPAKEKPHPAERPLTEANMRQQEMLRAFTMSFGRRRTSVATGFSGISPGNSRQASMDAGHVQHPADRRVSSLAHDVPREEAETT